MSSWSERKNAQHPISVSWYKEQNCRDNTLVKIYRLKEGTGTGGLPKSEFLSTLSDSQWYLGSSHHMDFNGSQAPKQLCESQPPGLVNKEWRGKETQKTDVMMQNQFNVNWERSTQEQTERMQNKRNLFPEFPDS